MKRFVWAPALLPALLLLFALPASAGYVYPDRTLLRVVDGDTIAYRGREIRVIGLNAPERHRVCPEEIALGQQAKAHGEELIAAAKTVRLLFSYRRTRDGRTVRATDKYGRYLAHLWVDRQDWAQLMIDAGLAKPWDGKGAKPSWCPAAQ